MYERDKMKQTADALLHPQSAADFAQALNAPFSPYKQQLTELIMQSVSLEDFFIELAILQDVHIVEEEQRRMTLLKELRDERAAEYISKRGMQFAETTPRPIRERSETISELQYHAKYLSDILAVEREKVPAYQETINKNKQELENIEKRWQPLQDRKATDYYQKLVAEKAALQLAIKDELANQVKKAFVIPPPGKLLQINRQVIRDAGLDDKKIDQCANTMAQKGGFVRKLKVLDLIGSTRFGEGKKDEREEGVIEEHVINPKILAALEKIAPPMPDVKEEKSELAKAIKLDNERALLQVKVEKVLAMEKTLNKLNDKIMELQHQPASPSPHHSPGE